MRKILTPEQVAQLVADVAGWIHQQAEASEDKDWQEATIYSIEQLAEIEEIEAYLVILRFPLIRVPFLLKHSSDGELALLGGYTFYPPSYEHPSQEKTAIQKQRDLIDDDEVYC